MSYSEAEFFPGVFPSACIPQDCNNCSGEPRERVEGGDGRKNNKSEKINHHLLMAPPFQMQILFS